MTADIRAVADRSAATSRVSAETRPSPLRPRPRKAPAVTGWIMTQPGELADTDRASLDAILAARAELAAGAASVRAFATQ